MAALTQAWDVDAEKNRALADQVVAFVSDLQHALARNRTPGEHELRLFIVVQIIALLTWVLLVNSLADLSAGVAYMVLLILASFLGTGLRLLARSQLRNGPTFTFTYVLTQATLSMLVAFGLMLVYLIGGISFTGEFIDLRAGGDSAIATGLSVIGFAAGFLLPIDRLRSQLDGAISSTSKG